MKLSESQRQQIKDELEKYILGGFMDRDQRTPILVGAKNSKVISDNQVYFESLKEWVEKISGKKTEWVAGLDGNEPFMGFSLIKNVETTEYDKWYVAKEIRFVIELKAVPDRKTGTND